uniref:Uncharacterized protein n=1 Tax=Haptolina brevifila TaxID=156173 RepID=A0A7S2D9F4_9EUKA
MCCIPSSCACMGRAEAVMCTCIMRACMDRSKAVMCARIMRLHALGNGDPLLSRRSLTPRTGTPALMSQPELHETLAQCFSHENLASRPRGHTAAVALACQHTSEPVSQRLAA